MRIKNKLFIKLSLSILMSFLMTLKDISHYHKQTNQQVDQTCPFNNVVFIKVIKLICLIKQT